MKINIQPVETTNLGCGTCVGWDILLPFSSPQGMKHLMINDFLAFQESEVGSHSFYKSVKENLKEDSHQICIMGRGKIALKGG